MDTSSIDIVDRLKEVRDAEFSYVTEDYKVLTDAADEIERLRADRADQAARIDRLRGALHEIETKSRGWERGSSAEINKIAKEALDE